MVKKTTNTGRTPKQSRMAAFVVCLLSALGPAQALAQARQQPAPAAAPGATPAQTPAPAVGNEPQATTAAFGDWVLRCARQGDAPNAPRICEVAQSIQVQGQAGPLAQLAIGRIQRTDPLRMTIVVPTNVSFPSVVRVMSDDKDPAPLDLAWRRCVPGACVADGEPNAGVIQRLRARTEPARFSFRDAAGREVAVPVSLRGLAQALDALAREAG